MSVGAPSNLGTLLIQRLDAALGTTLGQQANLVSGAGPQAVPQPGNPENPTALQNPAQRHPRESVDQASAEGQRRAAAGKAVRELQLDNLLGRSSTFRGTTQSAPTTLGYAARIILALLNEFPQASQTIQGRTPLLSTADPGGQAAPAATSQPGTPTGVGTLLPTSASGQAASATQVWAQLATALNQPGALAARFAQALLQSIQQSGLFYESHLMQLAAGGTSAQALRQEPQGQLASPAAASAAAGQPAVPAQPGSLAVIIQQAQAATAELPQGAGPRQDAAPAPQNAAGQAHTGQSPATHGTSTIPGIDPQTQFLVRQQLEVLANQGFVWQGEAWPGADMQWEVQRRHPGDARVPEATQEYWSTRLALQLPSLGDIQARLSLSGDQLVMRLTAPRSADRLSEAIEPLRSRLLAQGLQASQLSVLNHDPDAPSAGVAAVSPERDSQDNESTER